MNVQCPPVDLHHLVGHPVEHVPVVGDEQQTARERGQTFLQEPHRVEVEVVGGLVEDQSLPLAREQCGESHPLRLASGQFVGACVEHVPHAEPLQHRLGLPGAARRGAHRAGRQHGGL